MASNNLNSIDFDYISEEAKYNPEGIESLPVDIQFCAEFATMQQDNMSLTILSDEDFKHTRETLAEMSLSTFKSLFRSSPQYKEILAIRRKEQKRINMHYHRIIDRKNSLEKEKLQLQHEIQGYVSMMNQ